ncbi:MAG: GGDEF domain-containing protein [Sulfurimonas sp.]|nr:GGDEF domain-containing protein [Sulfurimonas sp.]
MQKSDLKALVEEVFANLMQRIDAQDPATKEQVIDYLKDAVDILGSIDDKDIDSTKHAKEAFDNKYKELVNQSLVSYEYTNEKFEQLTLLHEKTLNDCISEQIDLPTLNNKFTEIQSHMSDEVKKANQIISQLSLKVEALEKTSNIDSLTKVFNRRALNTYLLEACSSSSDGVNYNIHVLMLDLDDFKEINDTYGHITGDKILIFISNILRKTLRDGDKIFRYGGEEFTIVLNRNSDEESNIIADRILKLISSNKLIYMGEKLSVTASIGLTKLLHGDTPDKLLTRADRALYISKHNGKNQVSKVFE